MPKEIPPQKPQVPIPQTKEEAQSLLEKIAECEAMKKSLDAILEASLTSVRSAQAPAIKTMADIIEAQRSALEAWAWKNQKGEFSESRSLKWTHGVIGFRWNPEKLVIVGRAKAEMILDKVRKLLPFYIRTKEEVNREQLLADAKTGLVGAVDLASVNLCLVKDEVFFCDAGKS